MRHLFVLDPLDRINPAKDSTAALMQAASRAALEVWVVTRTASEVFNLPSPASFSLGTRLAAVRRRSGERGSPQMGSYS